MGLGTIITMLIYVAVPLSDGFVYFVQVLFWIDVVIAILCCFAIPMLMYSPDSPQFHILFLQNHENLFKDRNA
jgi:hypothetical protein